MSKLKKRYDLMISYIMVTNDHLVFPNGPLTLDDLGDETSFVHSWEEINLCESVHAARGST